MTDPSRHRAQVGRGKKSKPLDDVVTSARGKGLRRSLAASLLDVLPGERLAPLRSMASQHRVGLGTLQAALSRFNAEGVVGIEGRGRMGTVLRSRDASLLWTIARGEPLIFALPLPTTPPVQGLATAIRSLLESVRLDAYMLFTRGSRRRIEALRAGRVHVAVMSRLAASALITPSEVCLLDLPERTLVREHRVFYASHASQGDDQRAGLRVIVDHDSVDFERLTDLEFQGQETVRIPATFMQFPRLLSAGSVDAAILDADEARGLNLQKARSRALSARVHEQLNGANTSAAFVGRASDKPVAALVSEFLIASEIMRIETEVLNHHRTPEY